MNALEKLHNIELIILTDQVKSFYDQKKKFKIYHGTTNSTRTQKFKKDAIVDISSFNRVLHVNRKEKFAMIEPNVPMDQLVEETLQYGLLPPVVMEFPGITAGGAIQGGAGESSSFKWGSFHHTCSEYEIVLGNGKVLNCSPRKNPELYWGTACSYGTLGIITKIKLRLIPAKPFVRLKYRKVTNFSEAVKLFEKLVKTKVDFIDGIMFSKNSGVIMTGILSEKVDLSVHNFTRPVDEWFYLHAQKAVTEEGKHTELIPIEDYLFRYNRGAFWVGKYAFDKGRIPFNRLTRFIFNPLFKTRTLFRFLQAINISQKQIFQDFILPCETALKFLDYIDKTTRIYPLWLLPGNLASKNDKLSPGFINTKLSIDVGVWGKPKFGHSEDSLFGLNRKLEKMLMKLGGRKVLYAHAYYSRGEFWKIYDKPWYDNLRKKYSADTVFPDIYDKTHIDEEYSISFWRGVIAVLKSPFKLPVVKDQA